MFSFLVKRISESLKAAFSSRVTDIRSLISSFSAFARLITSFGAVKFLYSGMSSFSLCRRTEEIMYPVGICKVQVTCNANSKMEIDRSISVSLEKQCKTKQI